MRREDWTGLGVSLGVHVLLVLLLAFLATSEPERQLPGYVEVDFGPIAEGRPVRPARTIEQNEPEEDEVEEDVEEQPAVAPPEEVKPVELPDPVEEIQDEEAVENPESDVIAPEEAQTEEIEEAEEPEPERVVRPLGSGSLEAEEGTQSGDDGTSNEEERSAPFQIEGLNRAPVSTPLPSYSEQVNALIRVRITVDPQGRITERIPLIKGDPQLEREVMNALLRWRFNPLPPDAPQENQTGVISFRFRLR